MMIPRLASLLFLALSTSLGLLSGGCSPGGLEVDQGPAAHSKPGHEPGHIPYDARRVALTTAQVVNAAQKGVGWVMGDAHSWISSHRCAACHRGGSVLTGQAIAKHNGLTIDNSATKGVPWLAQFIKNEQQADGGWTHSGTYRKSKTAWSLSGLAQYTQWSGSSVYAEALKPAVNYLNGVASTRAFPNDGKIYAGQSRRYIEEDLGNCPVDCTWPINTSLTAQSIAVLLKQPSLTAAEYATYSAFRDQLVDALEGTAVRNLANNGWGTQYLSYALMAMSSAGRTPANNANALAIRDRLLTVGGAANSGWGDVNFGYGSNPLSTGQALFALCLAGTRLEQNAVIQNGIDYLYKAQAGTGSWSYGGLTLDVPTTFATVGLACYGALNVSLSNGVVSPQDPNNPNQALLVAASPDPQTVSFQLNLQNIGLVTNTFVLSANAGLGATVNLSTASLTIPANSGASATVTAVFPPGLPASAQAPISVVASYTGANGLVSETSTVNVFVGEAPAAAAAPTTTAFTAGAGATVAAGGSLTLSAQVRSGATLLSSGATQGSLTFYYGATVIATVTTSNGTFTHVWAVPPALQGNQAITAKFSGVGPPAAVQYGPSSATSTVAVTSLPAPPAPTLSGPPSGTTSSNGSVTVTGASQAGAIITARDATGANLGSASVPVGGAFALPLDLAPGLYDIAVIATNAAGNSPPSSSFTISVLPARPVLTGPLSGTITSDPAVVLSGTGAPGATVTVRDGGVVVGTFPVAANGTFSGSVVLPPGAHDLSVTQTVAGVLSSPAAAVQVGVLPPAPVILSPAGNAVLPFGNNAISGTGAPGSTVTIFDGGVAIGAGVVAANGQFNITVPLLYGDHALSARASNEVGQSALTAPRPVKVVASPPIITTPAADGEVTGGFTIAGTGVPGATVKLYDNGALLAQVQVGADGRFSHTVAAPSLGEHSIAATQTAGGQTSPISAARTVVVYLEGDGDRDNIIDVVDNCLAAWNQDQVDRDGDGLGDVCDAAPAKPDASNTSVAVTDGAISIDPRVDSELTAPNQCNRVVVPAGAWASRSTLTLVQDLENARGNIEIWGKKSPAFSEWTRLSTYDLQLGASHGQALADGLQAQVAVVTPRTSLVNYAFRYRQFQVRVREADGSITTIPHCASGMTVGPADGRCVIATIAYTKVNGTNVDAGVKLIFNMKAL